MTNDEGNPNDEIRNRWTAEELNLRKPRVFRASEFGFISSFGIVNSDLRMPLRLVYSSR